MYKYSIIIPHHNIPHLLRRLLRTVPQRVDLQVIVVDDCSTKELDKLLKLKEEYDWVEWYDTEINGGGGKARNIGLDHAKGEYVIFADADDFFLPNIDDLLDKNLNNNFDILFFNVLSLDSNTLSYKNRIYHLQKYLDLFKKNKEKGSLYLKYLFGEPWCKIIRRDIIQQNKIRFDEVPIHNDTFFSYMIGHYAKNIVIDNKCYYCVTERNNSVSKGNNPESNLIRLEVFAKKIKFFEDNKIPLFDYFFIMPFKEAKNDKRQISKLIEITEKYGFSKKFIARKKLDFNKYLWNNRFLILKESFSPILNKFIK